MLTTFDRLPVTAFGLVAYLLHLRIMRTTYATLPVQPSLTARAAPRFCHASGTTQHGVTYRFRRTYPLRCHYHAWTGAATGFWIPTTAYCRWRCHCHRTFTLFFAALAAGLLTPRTGWLPVGCQLGLAVGCSQF